MSAKILTSTANMPYEDWFTSGELSTYDDIEILLEDTADAIHISINTQETGEP